MKKASISETKNHLSQLLEEVKSGTTILILDRNRPMARLEPLGPEEGSSSEAVATLVRNGLAASPRRALHLPAFLERKMVRLPAGTSAVQTLLSEREADR
jgi:prevent-host-death family protein